MLVTTAFTKSYSKGAPPPCHNFQTAMNPCQGFSEDQVFEMHLTFFIYLINSSINGLITFLWKISLVKLWSCFWYLQVPEDTIFCLINLNFFNYFVCIVKVFQIISVILSPIFLKISITVLTDSAIAEKFFLSDCSNNDKILVILRTSSKNII